MKKHLLLSYITCIVLSAELVIAQSSALKKANKYYSEQAYAQAIPLYEKAYKADSSSKLVLSNLGDCYRLTNNAGGQLKCYGGLIRYGKAEPVHKLYYGQALLETGKPEEAKGFFEQYTNDERGKELAASIEKRKQYSKNADAYKLEESGFNSPEADFCAVKYMNDIVFATSRTQTKWINVKHAWTDQQFLNVFTVSKSSGRDIKPHPFMSNLNSKFNDGPVCFNKEFNKIYFTRNTYNKKNVSKDGTYKLKIFEANLNASGLDHVTELPFNKNDHNTAHPSLADDGSTLYFSSDMDGGFGGMDLYKCVKNPDGTWGTPENLGNKVNSAGNEVFPFIAPNGVLYFSSNGHDGLGGLDVYETRIKDGKATRVYNMGEPVNSKDDDFGVWLGDDSKTGYISSNRKNGGLDDDIYNFQILREVKRGKEVTLITKDKDSGEILPNTKVLINGDSVLTNENGQGQITVEEDLAYNLIVEKNDYFKLEDSVSVRMSPEDAFTKELLLEKDPKLAIKALVMDAKNGQPLEGVKITIKEMPAVAAFDEYTTNAAGDYRKPLKGKKVGDKVSYQIVLEKEKYLPKTLLFNHDIKQAGDINLNEFLDMRIGMVEVGMDLAKMVDLKPIYFDLGKSTIRKDAATELDKIVAVMKQYPNMSVELGSHTDCRGAAKSNLGLSDKRAKASAAYIVKKGIKKDRIAGKGYGESKLLNSCGCEGKVQSSCSEDEHSKNRRTEFIITKLK